MTNAVPGFLREPQKVPFESLYLDPNNPRLSRDDAPGYDDPDELFDDELQKDLEMNIEGVYAVDDLEQAIIGQGWMPIDNIVVWPYPDSTTRYIVLEGNTRTVSLRRIRSRLPRELDKLKRMQDGKKKYAAHDIKEQEGLVAQIQAIVAATQNLSVVPLDAKDVAELKMKLPRVLAVRHITGAKGWGNYAEDVWLLRRYEHLLDEDEIGSDLRWDRATIAKVAHEASLGETVTRRKLLAAACFSHFTSEFEDQLPESQEFSAPDYYLFENIIRKPWLRSQFGLGDNDTRIPTEGEKALFEWVFKLPRGTKADENPNVFYRHENVLVWDQIKRYDDGHGTSFAQRFDVSSPETAPRMAEVEADYLAHKARRRPTDILEQLISQLSSLSADSLVTEGEFLAKQLERVQERTSKLLAMIKAAEKV